MNDTIVVRDAGYRDVDAMTQVLAAAFATDDPIGEFLFPDPGVRARREPKMQAAMIRHRFLPQGNALVALMGDRVVGTLLWDGSEPKPRPIHAVLGGIALLGAMGTRVSAGMTLDAMFAEFDPGRPHNVGVYLGCAPDVQRRGVGRALLKVLLARCDRDGRPLYLMCKDGNVDYYRGIGWELVDRPRLGHDGPVVNVMVRPPE
ncbi:GNAT family N-acetyltransferase [Mycobacterium sp. 3519A]|uniref:GNAT family N-acetyltransferase n=1 Tax=Mycobacterium sp. 3519A TaxID=2057184 RepID=UPI000C7CAEB0|nr:GNAT family N-acetyltransferase [Mycobacterium sp. 3519A]